MNVGVLEIEKFLRDYQSWLKDRATLREVNGEYVEITTPYIDRHNDALQIYARRKNGGFVLTDDSYTIHDLEATGCILNTGKRQDLLKMTLNGFGVKLNHEALGGTRDRRKFPRPQTQSHSGNAGRERSFLSGEAGGGKSVS